MMAALEWSMIKILVFLMGEDPCISLLTLPSITLTTWLSFMRNFIRSKVNHSLIDISGRRVREKIMDETSQVNPINSITKSAIHNRSLRIRKRFISKKRIKYKHLAIEI